MWMAGNSGSRKIRLQETIDTAHWQHNMPCKVCANLDREMLRAQVEQVISDVGEQRHGNAEDRVAQHFQPAHFERTDLRQICPRISPIRLRFRWRSSYAGHA